MTSQLAAHWLLGLLVGSMLFFAIVVAPTVFRSLPGEQAGSFLRALFPRYYLWGGILACLGVPIAIFGSSTVMGIACALVALLFVYARQVLIPAINRARDAQLAGDGDAASRFRRLHLQSVLINLFQLLLLIGVGVYLALRP